MQNNRTNLPSHFKIKVFNREEAKKIILILNTYDIVSGIADNLSKINVLDYPRIFYIKKNFISQSTIDFVHQNDLEYGPEYKLKTLMEKY